MRNTKTLYYGIAFSIGVLLVILLVFFISQNSESVEETIDAVTIRKDSNEITVSRDGSVVYSSGTSVYFDSWSQDKAETFLTYFASEYSGDEDITRAGQNAVSVTKNGKTYTYILDNSDSEFVDVVQDDATENDNNDTATGGSDVGQYFSPTPQPTSTPVGGATTPTPTPYNGGGGDPNCLYWRLSYCVVKRTPTPAPTVTGTPNPDSNVIQAQNCEEYIAAGNTKPVIISNTVCLPE